MNPFQPCQTKPARLMILTVCLTFLIAACRPAVPGLPPGVPGGCPPVVLDALPNPDEAPNYIGRYVNDLHLPSGLTYAFGKLAPAKGDKDDDHIWSIYLKNDGSYLMAWGTLVCRGSKGSPYWQISDAAATGPLSKDQVPAGKCYNGKDLMPYIFAVTDSAKGGKNNVEFAWQVDTQTNKIGRAATGGISCIAGSLP